MDILIDKMSAQLFQKSDAKSFIAVLRSGKQYSLRPLRQGEEKSELKYEAPTIVGEGTYGKVQIYPTERIAVKYSKSDTNNGIPDDIVKEIAIYRLLSEISCLPKLFGFDLDKGIKISFDLGSSTLTPELIKSMTNEQKTIVMFRLLKCMRSAASQGLIHADLKPINTIISANGNIQIIDWGLAEIDRTKCQKLLKTTQVQTLWWKAPEILLDKIAGRNKDTYSNKIDIFSLGLIFYEILIGRTLANERDNDSQYNSLRGSLLGRDYSNPEPKVKDSVYHIVQRRLLTKDIFTTDDDKFMTEEQADLLSHMFEFNPVHRWDYDKLILHPVFQTIKRENIPKQPIFINNFLFGDISTIWNIYDTTLKMRKTVFDWLIEVCIELKLNVRTLCASWQIIDIYKSMKPETRKTKLQLLGSTAFLIASKTLDSNQVSISDLVYFSDKAFMYSKILDMEKEMFMLMEGNILFPTVYDYQTYYHDIAVPPISQKKQMTDFCLKLLQIYEDPQIYSGKYYTKDKLIN
jgi:serine/threonine protein kinase